MLRTQSFRLLLPFLLLVSVAQDFPEAMQQPSSDIPVIRLEAAFSREVPFVTLDALTIPILCAADGTNFVQLARINEHEASSAMGDILAISRNGNQVVQFSLSKINDIDQPSLRNFAVSESDIYVLVKGIIPQNKVLTFRKPNGEIFQQSAARSVDYIAHFKKDGSYLGAVQLDIPFEPIQIGIFPGGEFLVAGNEKSTFEPRIALVRSSGQLQRFVELPGDLHPSADQQPGSGSSKNADPAALPQFSKTINGSLWGALNLSMIIADGRNLLLVRPGYRVPVFSISPGGEVTTVHLEMPAGYALEDLKTDNGRWMGIYTKKREDGDGVQVETVSHNPVTGKIIARYAYPRSLGLAVGCVNQDQLSVLTTQDGKLLLNLLSIGGSREVPH